VAMRNRGANWRQLAKEARTIADGMHDDDAKQTMLAIAERYEILAAYSERQATKEAKD
jgi:hypothetical protein